MKTKKIEFEIPTWLYGIMYILGCACIGAIIGVCIGLFINYLL